MVALPETFAPQDIPEDERSFEPIPAGLYKMQVIESSIADTKSGSGQILKLTIEVIEGQFANRRIFENLNVRNDNPTAQSIAQRALADLCNLLGIAQLRDTEELHFHPFTARVTVQQDKSGQYGPQNRIRYNIGKQGAPGAAQPARTAPQGGARPAQQAQKPAVGGKPWNNPKPAQKPDPMDDEIPF